MLCVVFFAPTRYPLAPLTSKQCMRPPGVDVQSMGEGVPCVSSSQALGVVPCIPHAGTYPSYVAVSLLPLLAMPANNQRWHHLACDVETACPAPAFTGPCSNDHAPPGACCYGSRLGRLPILYHTSYLLSRDRSRMSQTLGHTPRHHRPVTGRPMPSWAWARPRRPAG